MKDFRQLIVWNKAHTLVKAIYFITKEFPKEEMFGLTSQLRRASSSIPTNIAEGCGRGSDADFKRFLQIAFGSANEVEYLLLLTYELGYYKKEDYIKYTSELVDVKKLLASFIKKLSAVSQ
ncbi:four helix bundle protein [Myroides odoratimimus]|uniref:four helix bundle protein n=1 Tax=Myroides odoratimimus TaxID=76832 RepID=UPI001CE075BE|nr:four helix bundle protein [Myroides odoratimimus]MCA4793879.1 four helix bundle protein [Myroides odoratimimus]MCA4821139.1 four helix bundle protein [Myroides odoratimimus]